MKKIIFVLFLFSLFLQCRKTSLEKINLYLEKGEFEKLLEFSNKNKTDLKEEELYLSSQAISKFQNFIRKNNSDNKYTNEKYIKNFEKKNRIKN